MFKNTSISFLGYINLIIIFLLLIPLFAGYWLYVEHRDFRQQSREFESRYIQSRKEIVRSVVDNTVNFIDFKTNQVERRVRESIRARVDQAHGMAGAIVESQTGWFPRARIERIVLESLRAGGWSALSRPVRRSWPRVLGTGVPAPWSDGIFFRFRGFS